MADEPENEPLLHVPPSQQSAQGPVPKPGEPVNPSKKTIEAQKSKAPVAKVAPKEVPEAEPKAAPKPVPAAPKK